MASGRLEAGREVRTAGLNPAARQRRVCWLVCNRRYNHVSMLNTRRLCSLLVLLPIAILARAAEPPPTGSITGTVRFTGKLPEPKTITTTDGATIKHNDLVVDGKTKGLRYVFAHLEDATAQ